ncbi:unnamed protein product [Blepharisma stoltei]|uniref:Uncharacterized protein n=1 Tax=Blepharisma stoltei TaxID=1481888 RepID=A0AAU9IWT2_9CILI|nr:unnamed protein product [Blepharisma stoltei]
MIGANSQAAMTVVKDEKTKEISSEFQIKTEAELSNLGHYYRSCPRNKIQAQEKRLMEKTLLSKVGPKEKEHQRKKILRNFFAWNAKQMRTDPKEIKFWNWIKTLNPDNVYSDERFKSMSYEFLDRLLSKSIFRETMSHWLSIYEPSLEAGDEDQKTRHFISFIRSCISIKDTVNSKKENFIADHNIEITFDEVKSNSSLKITQKQPISAGCYFEIKCTNPSCSLLKAKEFVYLGNGGTFEYLNEAQSCVCRECRAPVSVFNVGFLSCKWAFKGNTTDGQYVEFPVDLCTGYTNLDEIKLHSWMWLQIKTCDLTSEENDFITGLVVGSFQDQTIPKKKYKKRKEISSETTCEDSGQEKGMNIELDSGTQFSADMISQGVQTADETDPSFSLRFQFKRDLDNIKRQISEIAFNTYKNEQTIAALKEEYRRLTENGQKKDV